MENIYPCEKALPYPRHTIMFIIKVVMDAFTCVLVLKAYSDVLAKESTNFFVFFIGTIWHLGIIITSFIIGTSSKQICNKIADNEIKLERNSMGSIEELCEDVRKFKNGLSPMLFIIFSTKCINLISLVLHVTRDSTSIFARLMTSIALISFMLDLSYTTLVVENTMNTIKGYSYKLR